MISKARWIATLALAAIAISTGAAQTVKTAQGEAKGKLINDGRVRAFLGLPYAAPPVGPLRFKAPEPPSNWTGVRDATQFGARCEQWHIWSDYLFLDAGPSEDCLFLNVYVPATAKNADRLPVMFWIHGGGYAAGAASEPRYTNSVLPTMGVILVTINYRLNVFGFLASDDLGKENSGSAGNYGLMDMVAALKWVHANIARFGGDPNNVTIFGESAGSFAVSTLLAVPPARELFAKAIGESGAAFSDLLSAPLATRAPRDQKWTESLGVHNLAELRALPASAILDAAQKHGTIGFGPVVDGQFVTEEVQKTYAEAKQAHVPLLAGWNRDERAGTLSKDMTVEKWKAFAKEHYSAHADDFLAAFPAKTDDEAVRAADDYTTDQFIALGTWKWVEAQAKAGVPVYRYRFDLPATQSEMHPEGKYAWHSDELEYVFGTLDVRNGAQWRPEDRKLSDQIAHYWTNFARTGDPNGKGLPPWPRYDTEKKILHFDSTISNGTDPLRPEFEFLESAPAH
jgi:para-nitrobenzyl esterase